MIFLKKRQYSKEEILSKILEDKNWKSLSETERKLLIEKLISDEKECICNGKGYRSRQLIEKYNIDFSGFKTFKTFFKWITSSENSGEYNFDNHMIRLKSEYKKQDGGGKKVYYILKHEIEHAFQDYLIVNKNKFLDAINDFDLKEEFERYIELLEICRGKIVNAPKIFQKIQDLKTTSPLDFYINGIIGAKNDTIVSLSNIFYRLNIIERDAFSEGKRKGDNFVNEYNKNHINSVQLFTNYDETMEQLDEFKSRYCFVQLNSGNIESFENELNAENEKIISLIDTCFYNLGKNNSPEEYMQASVMYDIYCLALYKSGGLSLDDCIKLLEEDTKERKLEDCGFVVEKKINIANNTYLYMTHPDKIGELTREQQKDNALIIILIAAVKEQAEISPYIKETQDFKDFCKANYDKIMQDEQLIDGVKKLLGEHFLIKFGKLQASQNTTATMQYSISSEMAPKLIVDEKCVNDSINQPFIRVPDESDPSDKGMNNIQDMVFGEKVEYFDYDYEESESEIYEEPDDDLDL